MNKAKVKLHTAFRWDCDSCGREVFERGFEPEMGEDDLHDAAVALGLIEKWQTLEDMPAGQSGEFVACPTEVECPHCGSAYETETTGA